MRSKTTSRVLILRIIIIIIIIIVIMTMVIIIILINIFNIIVKSSFFFTNLTVVLAGIGTGQVAVHRPCVPDDVLKALKVRKMITMIILSSPSSSTCMLSSSSSSSWLTVLAKVSLSVNSSTKAASSSLLG